MEELEEYIPRSQNTVAQYISVRLIMVLCEEAVQQMGTRVSKWLWYQ